jgi:hypothetical protein
MRNGLADERGGVRHWRAILGFAVGQVNAGPGPYCAVIKRLKREGPERVCDTSVATAQYQNPQETVFFSAPPLVA